MWSRVIVRSHWEECHSSEKWSLPVMGVSSSRGCADISIATLPSKFCLLRLMETGRLSDSMALTVNSVASTAGSTGMFWHRVSYWSVFLLPPCSDQSSSCSHWGGSGMSALKWGRKDELKSVQHYLDMLWHGNLCKNSSTFVSFFLYNYLKNNFPQERTHCTL